MCRDVRLQPAGKPPRPPPPHSPVLVAIQVVVIGIESHGAAGQTTPIGHAAVECRGRTAYRAAPPPHTSNYIDGAASEYLPPLRSPPHRRRRHFIWPAKRTGNRVPNVVSTRTVAHSDLVRDYPSLPAWCWCWSRVAWGSGLVPAGLWWWARFIVRSTPGPSLAPLADVVPPVRRTWGSVKDPAAQALPTGYSAVATFRSHAPVDENLTSSVATTPAP